MATEGELYDINGVPIYRGDLIRTFHFRGPRRRIWYLYHVAVLKDGRLELAPTSHLEPTKIGGGGRCMASQSLLNDNKAEVISGSGPDGCLCFIDRPRRKTDGR